MNQKTKNLVGAGVFTAIVLVLQFLGGTFKIGPLNINVSLVPIVVGAAVYGWKVGALCPAQPFSLPVRRRISW